MEELAGLGATVHTCARNEAELNSCLKSWEDNDECIRVTGSVCDVSSRADREKLMDATASVFEGNLNILVRVFSSPPSICRFSICGNSLYKRTQHPSNLFSKIIVHCKFLLILGNKRILVTQ